MLAGYFYPAVTPIDCRPIPIAHCSSKTGRLSLARVVRFQVRMGTFSTLTACITPGGICPEYVSGTGDSINWTANAPSLLNMRQVTVVAFISAPNSRVLFLRNCAGYTATGDPVSSAWSCGACHALTAP